MKNKKILILAGGGIDHLLAFSKEAKKLGLSVTLASFSDLEYDFKGTGRVPVIKMGGEDLASFDTIYFRLVGKRLEDASIVADYALETKLLFEKGLPVPRTLFLSLREMVKKAPKLLGFPFVIKGTNGKQGHAVWSPENQKELEGLVKNLEIREGLGERFLAQEFIRASIRIRVLIIGGKAKAAIVRPTRWRTRFDKGKPQRNAYKKVPLKYSKIAQKAAKSLYIDIAGVDLLEDKDKKLYVLEVNSAPRWYSTKKDTGLNVEREILKFLIAVKPKHKILMDEFAKKASGFGYSVREYPSDKRVYEFSKKGKSILTLSKHLPLNSIVGYKLARRKHLTKEILTSAGIPTPAGILTDNWDDVLQSINTGKIGFPLVAKPDISSLGKFVAAKIDDLGELKSVFERVKNRFKSVLIEEYVGGEDYRFLVLDRKVLAVAHRILPFVTADGRTKISGLIAKYNKARIERLKLGYEVERVLGKQGYSYNSVPAKGTKVLLRRNSNAHTGGIVENPRGAVHPKYFDIAIKATKSLGLRFCGVDIISEDITSGKSRYFVIELNADPGYDLHLETVKGIKYDATKDILKSLFSVKSE
ncbi:MAG: ATP-grasp domain-containing protein [Candidatus Woesebacteria bacterium]|nr:ATP-grasp domain-containing protein [Candidatus Woesebacteria bacterium]